MQNIWKRIESWLGANVPELLDTLNPGASDAAIADAEAFLGVTLPDDVRASYKIHDGQSLDNAGLLEAREFLSLERIKDEWKVWKDLLDAGDFEGTLSEPHDGIKNDWWNPAWIPLTYDGSGNHDCLDLDPAPGGKKGQIIEMWHDDPERVLVSHGFREWLEEFADGLEADEYAMSDDYGGLMKRGDM
ncbi:MAG: SMI1/KNR4 family protein [Chloroflexia bacterium]